MLSEFKRERISKERIEKVNLCKMVGLGLDPTHDRYLKESASIIVDDLMNLLYDWGFVEIAEDYQFERYEIKKGECDQIYFQVNRDIFNSRNQMQKRIRQLDWQSKEWEIIRSYSRRFLDL